MSAFIVSAAHLSAIVDGAIAIGAVKSKRPSKAARQSMLGMLAEENYLSVSYRYGGRLEDESVAGYVYVRGVVPSLSTLVKLIDCLVYQSCEHPEWEASDACAWLATIRARAVSRWVELGGTDGGANDIEKGNAYRDAPWGL